MSASATLARYAVDLDLSDVPAHVVARARECLIDTIAISLRGREMPWSRIAVETVRQEGTRGNARLMGIGDLSVRAESAAFGNGFLAHALELDSLRKPGAGVHPGAVIVAAALAAAQDVGASGRDLLAACIAGFEVMMRIGAATQHSAEPRGFHAPGLTGPFGAAASAGRLFGLDADRMNTAFGIAGSTCAGLMQFAHEGQGAMVKRLHIGRAAQNGVMAARLAQAGFTGPHEILEGRKGFLATYCEKYRIETLTEGLGSAYETLNLCLKRYPCHITAHTPVYAIERLRQDVGLTADRVASIKIFGTDRMADLNGDREPSDAALANYSIPFCVAAALTAAPDDPASFDPVRLQEPALRDICRRIDVVSDGRHSHSDWMTKVIVTCHDGAVYERITEEFPGTPAMPLSGPDLERRFHVMSSGRDKVQTDRLFRRLSQIETEATVDWIH